MKDKASVIVMTGLLLLGGAFLFYFGYKFLSGETKKEEDHKKKKDDIALVSGIQDTIMVSFTMPEKSIGILLNFHLHLKGHDTLFHFTNSNIKKILLNNKGKTIACSGTYNSLTGETELGNIFSGQQQLFPEEEERNSNPLSVPGILFMILGGGMLLFSLAIVRKIGRYFRAVSKFIHQTETEYHQLLPLSDEDFMILKLEESKVKKDFYKNIALGIGMIVLGLYVPQKFLGIKGFIHSYGKPEGDQTLAEMGGMNYLLIFLFLAGLVFLYILGTDLRRFNKDLKEKKKIISFGKIIRTHSKKGEPFKCIITLNVMGMELEEIEISKQEHPGFFEGTLIKTTLTPNSQVLLNMELANEKEKLFFSQLPE